MLAEFISYLQDQIGQPYLWGGQHTKLTPENYKSVIHRKEAGRGSYPDGTTYEQAAIDYCEKMFAKGYTILYAYDCSGLGVYWLTDLKHLWKSDVNSNTMMGRCELRSDTPKRGWWVFRLDGKRACHIGYMVDDEYLIEAKGRKYGVVKTKFRPKDWDRWGIPNVFKDEIIIPPEPTGKVVEVIGKSVNVRNSDSTKGKVLLTAHSAEWYKAKGIAHGDDKFPFISTAPSGWYEIDTDKGYGYITNLPRYTKLIEG